MNEIEIALFVGLYMVVFVSFMLSMIMGMYVCIITNERKTREHIRPRQQYTTMSKDDLRSLYEDVYLEKL
jgi:hypothetical protein